jgi:hypothetical protein
MTILQSGPARTTDQRSTAPAVGLKRRRSNPHMLLGAVLVVVCALAFAVTGLRVDPRTGVLALANAVPAGHVLTDADLMVVQIVPDPSLGAVPQAQRSTVVAHPVRLPLAAHSLLSQDVLGPSGWPPSGQALIAVAVKSGHAPAGITAGAQVVVLVVPASSSTSTAAGGSTGSTVPQAPAAVYAIGATDSSGTTVVSLLMNTGDAKRIASAPGDAALVVQGGAG